MSLTSRMQSKLWKEMDVFAFCGRLDIVRLREMKLLISLQKSRNSECRSSNCHDTRDQTSKWTVPFTEMEKKNSWKLEDSTLVIAQCGRKRQISICILKDISPSCSSWDLDICLSMTIDTLGYENSPICICDEIETVEHFMWQCGNYENARAN